MQTNSKIGELMQTDILITQIVDWIRAYLQSINKNKVVIGKLSSI